MKKTILKTQGLWLLMLTILLFQSFDGLAQTNYYPSSTGGNWGAGASWSKTSCGNATNCLCTPTLSTDIINLTCAKTITVTSNVISGGAITISGGTLIVNSGVTLTCSSLTMTSGTLTVNGTLNVVGTTGAFTISGGTFNASTGTIGLTGGAQNLSCTQNFYNLNIAGSGNKTMLTNVTVNNQLILTTNNLIVGDKTLTVGNDTAGAGIVRTSGKMTLASTSNLSLGGNWTQNDLSTLISNTFPLTINNLTLTNISCTVGLGTGHNLTVAGAFTLTKGKFVIGNSTLMLNGAILGNIFGKIVGGSTSDLTIGGSGSASMYFDLSNTNSGGSNTIRNFTNNRTSNPFIMLSSLRIGGTLSQAANAKLQITTGPVQTLTIDGTVSGTSKIIGNSGANLYIDGSGSMGGTLIFDTTPQLSSLTMDRIGGTASIGSAFSVGNMSFKFGVLTNSALTTVTGGTSNSVTQDISSSYLNGPMAQTIAANTSGASFIWPIGKTASQKLSFNGITTGSAGNVVIVAEAFDGNSGGTPDATLSDLKTDNYWSASAISNAANLGAVGSVSLSDSGLTASNAIGYSPTLAGTYTSLGGSVASGAITSTEDAPAALGFYNIGTTGSECVAPTPATISATSTVNCGVVPTTLSIASGSLNDATNWQWYTGSCGAVSVGSGTSINVSPAGTTTYYVRGEGGCVTPGTCSQITITVNTPQNWYLDADNDGHYVSGPISQCTSPGEGYNTTATQSGDCDDSNAAVYNSVTYYVDADQDGYDNGTASVCSDASTPTGYSTTTLGFDCNDASASIYQTYPFYADNDGDGYGAGVVINLCVAAASPAPTGFSLNNSDCNDANNQVYPGHAEVGYNLIDDDCDGLIDEGFPPKNTTITGPQCNTTLPAIDTQIYADVVAGAQFYQWRVTTLSGPTAGQVQFLNTPLRAMRLVQLVNYAFATTYKIELAVFYAGYLQPYTASTCTVTTPATTTTLIGCGQLLTSMSSVIYANNVPYATGYRFRISDGINTTVLDRPLREFRMNLITDFQPKFNKQYTVEVAIRNTTGEYLGYGAPCTVNTPPFPTTFIQDSQCEDFQPATMNTLIYAESYPGAIAYVFKLMGPGLPAVGLEVSRPTRAFKLSDFTGLIPSATYTVYVRLVFNTGDPQGPTGKPCTVVVPGPLRIAQTPFNAMAYPNPFESGFMLNVSTSTQEKLQVKVYDMTGRMLDQHSVEVSELESMAIGEKFPSGVYNVVVSQGDQVKTLRVVKR